MLHVPHISSSFVWYSGRFTELHSVVFYVAWDTHLRNIPCAAVHLLRDDANPHKNMREIYFVMGENLIQIPMKILKISIRKTFLQQKKKIVIFLTKKFFLVFFYKT